MPLKTETLASMCEAVVDCPHSTPVWTDSGFVVLRNQNIKDGRLDLTTPSYTDREHFKHRTRRLAPRAGDIVITREAPMGEVCKIPVGLVCCLGQRQVLLRPKSDIDPDYLLYALQSPFVQNQIRWNEGTGSTVSNIRIPVLEKIDIPRHGDAESTIAKMLSSVDAKMDINRRINQTLEAMAQAIFKSWFVDFDPVKAKIAAKAALTPTLSQKEREEIVLRAAMSAISGKPDAELDALPPEQYAQLAATAALFPDEMDESELGEIPRGWEVQALGKFITVKRGGSPRPIQEFMAPSGLPWVKIADATAETSPFLFETREFIKESGLKKTVYLKRGALILTNSATPGLPKFLELDACIHDGWLYFPEKRLFTDQYLYFLFQKIRYELVAQGNGSVFTNLKTDILRGQRVLVPSHETMASFTTLATSILENIKSLAKEGACLAALRDTLLPKLLSGELSVASIDTEPST